MLHTIVDVEHAMLQKSLEEETVAAFFFDFKAAFPSIAHEYMFKVLRSLHIPEGILRLIKALYDNNKCIIAMGGSGFLASSLKQELDKDVNSPPYCLRL